ncbi:MAG: hypothetical protein ACI857_003363 [Arenicella sp.]|jgi:uncharacterized protein YbjT (DUF2867 family)
MSKTAIILGSSGLTGSLLLEKLLKDDSYSKVKLFSRSKGGISNSKIEEHIIDLLDLEKSADNFKADEVFCCIGTTKKKTPDKEMYHQIDFGIPLAAAKLCKLSDIPFFAVVSAMGAYTKSSIFYNRTKGEMEAEVLKLGIERTYILRPALITGDRNEKRSGEKFFAGLFAFFNLLLIGPLKKYRSIKAERIAQAMLQLAKKPIEMQIIESREIQKLADFNTFTK